MHFFAMVIENGLVFYLSSVKPKHSTKDQPWYGYMGPQQATQFKTETEATRALVEFSRGKGKLLVGTATVKYFTITNKVGAKL